MSRTTRALARALSLVFAVSPVGYAVAPRVALAAPPAPKGELTKPPKLVHFVEAAYPPAEKAAGATASVTLRITIAKDGAVTNVEVAEPTKPDFDAAAVEAARGFVFEPGEVDGAPMELTILYRYVFKLEVAAPTDATFSGTVRDRDSKAPLADVVVTLDGAASATTDSTGHFLMRAVAPGHHSVSIARPGAPAILTEEDFVAGQEVKALYDVEAPTPAGQEPEDDLEVVVVAPKLVKAVTTVEVKSDEARRVPGTQGDVLQVVQNLPGVGRAAAGSGQLVVWGAAPEDTRVYVEGIRVPLLYHYGGVRSVIHSDFVRAVDLVPGGYDAAYGRGLGGIVTVDLTSLDASKENQGFHGSSEIDVLDYAGSARAGVGEAFRSAVAFRYGFLDKLVPLVTSADVGELFPVPKYLDAQARVVLHTSASTSIEVGGFGSSDSVHRAIGSADPASVISDDRSLRFGRGYVRIDKTLDDNSVLRLTPWFGRDERSLSQASGALGTSITSNAWVFGFRGSYSAKLLDKPREAVSSVALTGGIDGELTVASLSREGSLGSPAREGDRKVFGEAPSGSVSRDDWSVVSGSPAVYGEGDFGFFKDVLHVVAGLRADPYITTTSRRTPRVGDTPSIGLDTIEPLLEPRLAARFKPNDHLELRAAWGLYHQPASPDDLSAVFGSPELSSSSGQHVLAGANVTMIGGLVLDLVGYYTHASDLSARSPLASPKLAQALEQSAEGRSYGVQFLLRKERDHGFFGWISYGISRSERRDVDSSGHESAYRLFDYDQTHVLTALASYDIWKGLEIGARFRIATGFPRTPVTGAYYDATGDTYRPLFGDTNSIRLPLFYQLDVRVSKTFKVGGTEIEAYLDVQNVTNHANTEEIVYSLDYRTQGAITGTPILPVIGARSSW